jgi:hypothetical protein
MRHLIVRDNLIRLGRLMDMMYRPSEIAEEIGVTTEVIVRSYLPDGCPFDRDKKGNLWIHGLSFVAWIRAVNNSQRHLGTLAEGEAWCVKCQKAVPLERPRLRHEGRYTKIYQGKCNLCGSKINRAYAASTTLAEVEGAP